MSDDEERRRRGELMRSAAQSSLICEDEAELLIAVAEAVEAKSPLPRATLIHARMLVGRVVSGVLG